MFVLTSGHKRGGSNLIEFFAEYKPFYYVHTYDEPGIEWVFPKGTQFDLIKEDNKSFISQEEIDKFEPYRRPETSVKNCLNMFRKRYMMISDFNLIQHKSQDNQIFVYTRPDCSLYGNLSIALEYAKTRMTDDEILIPAGGNFHGGILDAFAIAKKSAMIHYLNCYSSLSDIVLSRGYPFHPETMLRQHLEKKLNILRFGDLDVILRGNKLNI